jgi:aromatic-L-amino-acid decarboxylase
MIYRYVPEEGDADAFNEKLVKFVHDDGRVFVSSTTIDGVYWIRMAVMSFRTHIEEVDLCLAILKEGAAQVRENLMAESGQLRTPSSS